MKKKNHFKKFPGKLPLSHTHTHTHTQVQTDRQTETQRELTLFYPYQD